MRTKKLWVWAVAAAAAVAAAGCTTSADSAATGGGLASCVQKPNSCNSGAVQKGSSLTYAINAPIKDWNLRHPAGTGEQDYAVLNGILPGAFVLQPDGVTGTVNHDLLTSVEQTRAAPQTIVYQIDPAATWSDGTPITAADFVYNWHVADGKHCPQCQTATAGYDQISSVTGSEQNRTVTVVFARPFTDWRMLFSAILPAHVANRYGSIDTPAGLAKGFNTGLVQNPPDWSGGPMVISQVKGQSSIVEKPNPKWWGTKPALSSVVFRTVTDPAQLPTALSNNEIDAVSVVASPDLAEQLKNVQGVSTFVGHGSTLDKLVLNLGNPALTRPVRQAILTAVDRKEILRKVLGTEAKRVKAVDSLVFLPGDAGYQDNLTASHQGSGDLQRAKALLTKAGYRIVGGRLRAPDGKPVPTLRFVYTTDDSAGSLVAQLVAAQLKQLGINQKTTSSQDLSELSTGAFDVFDITAGVPGYPFYAAGIFYAVNGEGNFGHYSNRSVDGLIRQAGSQTDRARASMLLNQADAQAIGDAPVLPLYTQPTLTAIRDTFVNIRPYAANFLTYNIGDWGKRRG